jgi:hypothetical protein
MFAVVAGLAVAVNFPALNVCSEETTTTNEPVATAESSSNDHWAFRAPMRPKPPSSKHSGGARSAIDCFVWARLEVERLAPSPPADRYALIRRVSLDLTGLPPSIEDVDAFIDDRSPNAYAKVVDRLLASPHYGERWALWWLDLARYADSNGYESDRTRSIWAYRDWVIGALNDDMPFDQFTIEQIAGDMLPDATDSQRIATGFHRNTWINEEGGHDWEQFRYESVVDRVHTTGTVFLGLTVACAQCHDHKYDPISQREYWQLFAFLNNAEIQSLRDSRPRFPTTFVFEERQDKHKRPTHIHVRGEYQRPDEEVSAAVPAVLHSFSEDVPQNRLTFAKWLVDDRNPLVARVIANQLWQSFFGRGIVSTPGNFGVEGAPPSHPKLLDWLAVELQHSGWSLKSLQRQIVMSAVYRQSSKVSPELAERDPQNILLARGPRFRVDAETIRDIALETSGLIVGRLRGPSVFPPQPGEAGSTFGPFQWKDSTGADRYRRGLYTYRKRGGPYAAFATFDAPPPNTCAMSRRRPNTPLQALAQLNDFVIVEASRALARRVLREGPQDITARVRHAFRLTLTRRPSEWELTTLVEFHEHQRRRFEEGSLDPAAVYGSKANGDATELRSLAAMTTLARLLLNLDGTITKE